MSQVDHDSVPGAVGNGVDDQLTLDEDGASLPARARYSSFGADEALGAGLPPRFMVEEFQQRVRGMLDSYLASHDADEAVRCFQEFADEAPESLDELVVSLVRTALERGSMQQSLATALLGRLSRDSVIDSPPVVRGFAKLLCTWEEMAIDYGKQAPVVLVTMLQGCITEGCVEMEFLTKLPEGLLALVIKELPSGSNREALEGVLVKLQLFKRSIDDRNVLRPCVRGSLRSWSRSATKALQEVAMPEYHHEFVKRTLSASFDSAASERGLCLDLLAQLRSNKSSVISEEDVQWGVIRLLGQLDDLMLDCPESGKLAAQVLSGMVQRGLVSSAFVMRCTFLRVGGATGLTVLEAAQQLSSDAASLQHKDDDDDEEDDDELRMQQKGSEKKTGKEKEHKKEKEKEKEKEKDREKDKDKKKKKGKETEKDKDKDRDRNREEDKDKEKDKEKDKDKDDEQHMPSSVDMQEVDAVSKVGGRLTAEVSLRPGAGSLTAGVSLRPGGGNLTGSVSLRPGGGGLSLRPGGGTDKPSLTGGASLRNGGKAGYPTNNGDKPKDTTNQAVSSAKKDGESWRNDKANTPSQKQGHRDRRKEEAPGEKSRSVNDTGQNTRPEKLQVSETSWAAQQRKRREQVGASEAGPSDEEIVRRMKSVLNKLTIEKFDDLFRQLVDCGISTESHVRIMMAEVFEKATMQHHFSEMYATLCVQLSAWFAEYVKVGNFKRILLDQCQASFEANLHPPADAVLLKNKDGSDLDASELEERKHLYKTRMLGNVRLVAQLLVKKMVASKVLISIAQELIAEPSPSTLEPLALMLSITGPEFDVPTWSHHTAFKGVFAEVGKFAKDKEFPARTRFLLQDVLDLRSDGWKDKKVATKKLEGPKKLADISDK